MSLRLKCFYSGVEMWPSFRICHFLKFLFLVCWVCPLMCYNPCSFTYLNGHMIVWASYSMLIIYFNQESYTANKSFGAYLKKNCPVLRKD